MVRHITFCIRPFGAHIILAALPLYLSFVGGHLVTAVRILEGKAFGHKQ